MASANQSSSSLAAMVTTINTTTEGPPSNTSVNNSLEWIPSLAVLNEWEVERLVVTIAYLLIICVLGIVGNGLVCHIYRTRYRLSNSQCFILCLSAIDMFSCCVVIPFEIATIVQQYTFKYIWLCKLSRFFNTMGVLSSSFLLLFIAIDRYRKVCRPFGWQISSKVAKILCALSIILGLLTSWPAVLIYGIKTIKVPVYGVMGTECSTDDKMAGTMFPLINTAVFGTFFMTGIVSICILYCLIGSEVQRHVNSMPKEFRRRNPSVPMLSGTQDLDARDSKLSNSELGDAVVLAKYERTKLKKNNNRNSNKRCNDTKGRENEHSWANRQSFELSFNTECSSNKGKTSQTVDTQDVPMQKVEVQSDSDDSGIKTDQVKDESEFPEKVNDLKIENASNNIKDKDSEMPNGNTMDTISESMKDNNEKTKHSESDDVNSEEMIEPKVGVSPSPSNEILTKNTKSTRSRLSSISSRISYAISRMTSVVSRRGSSDGNAIAAGKKQYLKQARARKTAFLMFLISLAFVLSYLPHLLLMLIRQLKSNFVENMADDGRAAYKFFLRSYFLNCAINPVIYGVCDTRFRVACKELFGRFCGKADGRNIS